MIAVLVLVPFLGASPEAQGSSEGAVELRALSGYLELYRRTLSSSEPSAEKASSELNADLRARLDRLLDRADLTVSLQAEAISIYHGVASAMSTAARAAAPGRNTTEEKAVLREFYFDLVKRAEAIGVDAAPLELEMISSPQVGLDAAEVYERLVRLRPRLVSRMTALRREERDLLARVIRRLLLEPSWPDLEGGAALTAVLGLLQASVPKGGELPERAAVAEKLADWTQRLLASEAAREGELAQGTALIHLYRSLELVGRALDPSQRAAALKGLLPLAAPGLNDGPIGEGALRSVEIGTVRLPTGGRETIPQLSATIGPGGVPGHFLVPGRFYQVELICNQGGSQRSIFWVMARAGSDSRPMLPRIIPAGMVPITHAETGRVGFLADRRPWSIRRFLIAFQRSWNTFSSDPQAVQRIFRHSVLREIPLPGGSVPSYQGLISLLSAPSVQNRLEETFWLDGAEESGRRVAFEIAGAVLSANTGLRDTTLSLPTVAEATRLYRDGDRFALDEPAYGLFNATRLIPDPRELGAKARYVIRAVQALPAP